MSYLLKTLSSKQEVDDVIRSTEDLVLVLRFGRDSDLTCMQLDEIVSCFPLATVPSSDGQISNRISVSNLCTSRFESIR